MNAEQLNIIARGILQLTGLSPEEIELQVKNQRQQKVRDTLKTQPRQSAPSLPKTPPVKPQPAFNPANMTAEQIYGKGRVNRSVNIARNMNPTAGLSIAGRLRGNVAQILLGSQIDNVSDYLSDNAVRPVLEAITGVQIPDIKDIKELGPKNAAEKLKKKLAADNASAVTAPSKKETGMSNIPPAEAQPGSPSYVAPAALPAATPTSRLQSGAVTAPAPVRPDYNSMSEMERLKIWATTNRKMIESVGTRQQLQILQRALSGIDNNTDLRQQGQATYNRGSA